VDEDEIEVPEWPWLLAAADQRIAALKQDLSVIEAIREHNFDTVALFLTEPPQPETPESLAKWERSCDACGKHCPGQFFVGRLWREHLGVKILITYGVCPACSGMVSG
jgi:hypothetical protein